MTRTASPHPPRRLTRSSSDKALAGVSGGLGEYFDLDPVLFRIGFAVATVLSGGVAALVYLALAVIVPADEQRTPSGARPVAG
jgi:phage shock protein C